ncbi:diisopropyl-fluorophosphatase-like [Lingula anatina]|uniref:Diisopropyl-fluorophosphatase-like n=1 Tax=Lingula anatina TaxID=7574 RepID=A0A1S3IKY2_LINAN|nr:diisopropyl-fluorophosphatase-like [Lingula anatina]|eukprot:XP_013398179.1 diisopropyl-fluorophosphatase-like [Lingula anatina]
MNYCPLNKCDNLMGVPICGRMADNPEVQILAPEFTKIAEGILGSEGPVFDRNGTFFMVEPEKEDENKQYAGCVHLVDLDTSHVTQICAPKVGSDGGIPAGLQCDKENNLWVADMRLGILRVNTKDGTFQQIARKDKDGALLQGCNDCAFDYDGNLWVTAPAGEIAPAPFTRSDKLTEEPFGSVYCMTASEEVIKVDTGYYFSNGIAVQHTDDGRPKKLIVAETFTRKLWSYDIKGPGQVENKQLWGTLPGEQGGPDGMDFDEVGNLIVANHGNGHLEVFGPLGGHPIYRIKCPFSMPSNVHFKPNSCLVFVTEHTYHGLWKFEWKYKGKAQYCELIQI